MWVSLSSSFLRLCFHDLECLPFTRLKKFLSIIYSNRVSVPFLMRILICLMLSQGSLKVSSFFKFFFLFAVPIRWFPLPYLVDLWSILFQPLACCWPPLVYFSFQLLYSSSLIFLYILSLCWSSEFIHSSLELMSIFTAINLIPLSGKFIWCLICLSLFHLAVFLGFYLVLSFWKIFLCFLKVKSLSRVRLFATPWAVAY